MPEITINGPEGRLEGRYLHGEQTNAPIALVLPCTHILNMAEP